MKIIIITYFVLPYLVAGAVWLISSWRGEAGGQ